MLQNCRFQNRARFFENPGQGKCCEYCEYCERCESDPLLLLPRAREEVSVTQQKLVNSSIFDNQLEVEFIRATNVKLPSNIAPSDFRAYTYAEIALPGEVPSMQKIHQKVIIF